MKKHAARLLSLIVSLVLLLSVSITAFAADEDASSINRFNVVVVLDASNSMNYTDPQGLRYEAISQFTGLLTEKGNYLGGIVFSNHNEAQQDPELINDQNQKDATVDLLKSVMSTGVTAEMGYTNMGEALEAATEMLVNSGSPDLPSVIVFLSDGNTEMPTDDEQTASLEQKAEAIQNARDNNIAIYSICLNANAKADISEMQQISDATGGVSQEVSSAEDLQDVFNVFYGLIYGTSPITLIECSFPADGKLETAFDVPGIGVEEVNIVINGKVSGITLYDPSGAENDPIIINSDTYTLIKITDITAGTWNLVTEGVPGDSIKINMIYNTNLGIDVQVDPDTLKAAPEDGVTVTATLQSGTTKATSDSQYDGYSAELQIMDAYGELQDTQSMTVKNGAFTADCSLDEGTYFINVHVTGNHLDKTSDDIGPISISADYAAGEPVPENQAPVATETPVKETVYVLPFKGTSKTIDMSGLASDPDGDELRYKIESSSFIEGTDYSVDGDVITIDHFSLTKGSFDISATDAGGLSCNIEVVITAINVGIVACIIAAIIALIVLIIVIALAVKLSGTPFRGTIEVHSCVNGQFVGMERTPRRGKCKLSVFQLEPVGLDYNKSYFQATGERYVILNTNIPVNFNGQMTKQVRIDSGSEKTISVGKDGSRVLYVRFTSKMNGAQRRPTGGGAHHAPSGGSRGQVHRAPSGGARGGARRPGGRNR